MTNTQIREMIENLEAYAQETLLMLGDISDDLEAKAAKSQAPAYSDSNMIKAGLATRSVLDQIKEIHEILAKLDGAN